MRPTFAVNATTSRSLLVALWVMGFGGCYRGLDVSKIKCDVTDKSSCPDGYTCSAEKCVQGFSPADAPDAATGPADSSDGAPAPADSQDVDTSVPLLGDASTSSEVNVVADAADNRDGPRRDVTPDSVTQSDVGLDSILSTTADAVSGDTLDAKANVDTLGLDTASTSMDVILPVLSTVLPTSGNPGVAVTLTLTGNHFGAGAVAFFGGNAVATAVDNENAITAQIPKNLTAQAGAYALWVKNGTGQVGNILYFTVAAATGVPEIVEYNPDNGVAGDTIKILGRNLTTEAISISDPNGITTAATAGATESWVLETLQTVQITLPANWHSGPIVATNAEGSGRGKIFTVSNNLARLPAVVVTASSQYDSSYNKTYGADNDLSTSWFAASENCVSSSSCTSSPWITVSFPSTQILSRIALRGNRAWATGFDFLTGRIEVLDNKGGVTWTGAFDFPDPDRDFDIALLAPLSNVASVRFTGLADEGVGPGLSELELF